MSKTGTAFFVEKPRVLSDLKEPHPTDREIPFEVVKTIALGKIAYENFHTDMVADRQFLEDFSHLCSMGNVWKCLFVHQRGQVDGILVMPDGCYVGWAAYSPAES